MSIGSRTLARLIHRAWPERFGGSGVSDCFTLGKWVSKPFRDRGKKCHLLHSAGIDDNALGFSFPAVRAKKLTAALAKGRLNSDGGVLLLANPQNHAAHRC
jgi:hypothetical protein